MSRDNIYSAVAQLRQSERGRATLAYLFGMLNGGATSLDAANQQAVVTLLRGAWGQFPGTVLEQLREEVSEGVR